MTHPQDKGNEGLIARLSKYLSERRKMTQIDQELIHCLNMGDDTRQAELTVSDIERALTALKSNGWQPIETAPKDGSMFMVWIRASRYCESDEGQFYEMDCSQPDFAVWKHDLAIGNGYVDYFSHPFADAEHATHWMPLPQPPQEKL